VIKVERFHCKSYSVPNRFLLRTRKRVLKKSKKDFPFTGYFYEIKCNFPFTCEIVHLFPVPTIFVKDDKEYFRALVLKRPNGIFITKLNEMETLYYMKKLCDVYFEDNFCYLTFTYKNKEYTFKTEVVLKSCEDGTTRMVLGICEGAKEFFNQKGFFMYGKYTLFVIDDETLLLVFENQ